MKNIRNPWRHIPSQLVGNDFVAYVEVDSIDALKAVGFSSPAVDNESILPNQTLNRATKENSNGQEIIRKDLPKESYSIDYCAIVPNFGDYSKGTHLHFGTLTRYKYKREYGTPELIHFLLSIKDGKTFVYSERMLAEQKNGPRLCLMLNLFRFCFGCLPQFSQDYQDPVFKIDKKEWSFLPSGSKLSDFLNQVKKERMNKESAFTKRLEFIKPYSVDNVMAVGSNGFEGYVCIKTSKSFIMECNLNSNATYIVPLTDDWEALSKMTKTDVIEAKLAKRVFHTSTWEENMLEYLQ